MTSTARLVSATLSGLLLVSTVWTRPDYPRPGIAEVATLGRDLLRPWLLPFLWRTLETAEDPDEYASRGRLLMRMLPEWTDGQVHIGWHLAFDASIHSGDVDGALDRLCAGLAVLQESLAPGIPRQDEILTAMGSILEIRCQDDALAARFRQRLGQDPFAVADDYLQQAQALHPLSSRGSQRIFLRTRMIAGLIRMGNHAAVRRVLDQTFRDLDRLPVSDSTQRLREALKLLERHLGGNAEVSLDTLAKEPYLEEIVKALEAR